MATAKPGDTVSIHYTGILDDGSEFDSSAGREPLQFTIGGGRVMPGFEQAVIGMAPGDSKTVTIPSEEAYGPYREEMVQEITRNSLPPELAPQIGMQLRAATATGQPVTLTVVDMSESAITVDANHPLAGKDLTFDIKLLEIA